MLCPNELNFKLKLRYRASGAACFLEFGGKMAPDTKDQITVMGAAILNAILDSTRAEDGVSPVDPVAARQALQICISMILEADPEIATRRDMRQMSEVVGREVRLQIEFLRDQYAKTGKRAWDAVPVTVQ